jgi:hypothetical protein
MLILFYIGLLFSVPYLVLSVPYILSIYDETAFDFARLATWLLLLMYVSLVPAILSGIFGILLLNSRLL